MHSHEAYYVKLSRMTFYNRIPAYCHTDIVQLRNRSKMLDYEYLQQWSAVMQFVLAEYRYF
ncbi:predicted protein [Botrytis cinerea T4]|uniref:Uncharacterized protein n=1 Tax=Botryotinia fuckeliana (strain T4) TaxID=999810 RepID=G2Y333_BOTF4|nr:predicted protein [Botrytis cinerea T4]